MKYIWTFLIFCSIFLLACNSSKKRSVDHGESFASFYQRFHQDSLFQMQRVRFPLDGYSIEGGRISPWSKDTWSMHKNGLNDIDTTIYTTRRIIAPQLIREQIFPPNSSMLIERHFSLLEKKWILTFYLYVFL